MKTLLGLILSPLYHLYFGLMLVLFHPLQVLALHIFGDAARKNVVDTLNGLLIKGLYIIGCKIRFTGFEKIPEKRPIIIIANHQSLYDIPPVVYGFRKFYPRFISKIELSRNLPSISYNLKHGQSALINRNNGTQAVKEILRLGRLIEKNHQAACIFPEGTRSKTSQLGRFMPAGVHTLLRAAPSAIVIPFVIKGHSELTRKGMYPLQFGQKISYSVLDPVEPANTPVEEMLNEIKEKMEEYLKKP